MSVLLTYMHDTDRKRKNIWFQIEKMKDNYHGDGQHITGVTIVGQKSGQEQQLPTNALFLGIGLTPNTKPFQGQLKLDKYGYIEVTNNTTTSADGVFVAGDVADYRYRQAITSAGSGCMAALDAEKYLDNLDK